MLTVALRDELGAPRFGLRLELKPLPDEGGGAMPAIAYDLIADHDWMMKPPP